MNWRAGYFRLFYLCQKPKKLKQASLILNIVLLLAVIFLFYKVSSLENSIPAPVSTHAADAKVVFVNSDSLMDRYQLFNDLKDRMEKKSDSLDRLLSGRGAALEKEVRDYQERAAGMSASERELREESLMRKQQGLMEQRESLLEELKNEEAALTDSIHGDLMKYLREFNRGYGYDFILGYTRGGGILLASDSLDITKQVLEGLNKKSK